MKNAGTNDNIKGDMNEKKDVQRNIHSLQQEVEHYKKEQDILLALSNDIAGIRSKNDLVRLINGKLKNLLPFIHGGIGLVNKIKGTYTAFLFDTPSGIPKGYESGSELKGNNLVDTVMNANHPVVFDLEDLVSAGQAPTYTRQNYEAGMKEMVAVGLRNEEGRLGFFGIFSDKKNGFNKNHLNILQAVSSQLSIAVANIIANEEILERESEKSMLLSLAKDITSCRTYKDVQELVLTKLSKYFQFNEILICLNTRDNLTYSCYMHMVEQETENHPEFSRVIGPRYFVNDGLYNVIQESKEPMILDMDELMMNPNIPAHIKFWHELNVKEVIVFPLQTSNGNIGVASLYPRKKNTFTAESLKLAHSVSSYLGIALSNIQALEMIKGQLEEIDAYKSKLERENLYLQEQIKTTYHYDEVIGSKNGLRNTFQLVSNVAPSDSTVLLLGETGTGKELIATAIHKTSPRRNRLMVKVNCAALPSHLIESELFGHEKGSFTGATERRIGKFELANNGTLFLDEIGEMTLELQAKLLRALQEKEIERIGGKSVIKTDVRIIAASNRNLKKEVEAGRFRRDLFYRLDVFPITLPPLRERREDIPMLVSHFINKFSKKSGQKIKNVSPKVIHEMMLYDWPGNIRELEHFIERSILMTSGDTITEVHLLQGDKNLPDLPGELQIKSLEENEREYILSILKKTDGKIRGAGGAAEILKIPPTTLHSKMKKLGLRKVGY